MEGVNRLNQELRSGKVKSEDTMGELICREIGCWKENKVRQNFEAQETKKFLKVPLCPELLVDRLQWKESPSGLFTVKSGYNLGMKLKEGSSEPDLAQKGFWKKLWGSNSTQRAKLFVWRVCHQALPVRFLKKGFLYGGFMQFM